MSENRFGNKVTGIDVADGVATIEAAKFPDDGIILIEAMKQVRIDLAACWMAERQGKGTKPVN